MKKILLFGFISLLAIELDATTQITPVTSTATNNTNNQEPTKKKKMKFSFFKKKSQKPASSKNIAISSPHTGSFYKDETKDTQVVKKARTLEREHAEALSWVGKGNKEVKQELNAQNKAGRTASTDAILKAQETKDTNKKKFDKEQKAQKKETNKKVTQRRATIQTSTPNIQKGTQKPMQRSKSF